MAGKGFLQVLVKRAGLVRWYSTQNGPRIGLIGMGQVGKELQKLNISYGVGGGLSQLGRCNILKSPSLTLAPPYLIRNVIEFWPFLRKIYRIFVVNPLKILYKKAKMP